MNYSWMPSLGCQWRWEVGPLGDILTSVQPQLAASTGAACASGIPEPSHVLRAMGFSNAEANSSIRFNFGRFTTGNEVEEAARLVTRSLESAQESVEPAPNIRS